MLTVYREADPAAHGDPVDKGDVGDLADARGVVDDVLVPEEVLLELGSLDLGHGLDVSARAEGLVAGPLDHDHVQIVGPMPELGPDQVDHVDVKCVERLWAVQGHDA